MLVIILRISLIFSSVQNKIKNTIFFPKLKIIQIMVPTSMQSPLISENHNYIYSLIQNNRFVKKMISIK